MIHFFAEEIETPAFDQDSFRSWLEKVAKTEDRAVENISYVFCSDDYLLEINKEHLNHDYYTDIITFPLNDDPIVSDIYISVDRVKENAQNFDVPFEKELKRVLVHGLLHMLGYNDKDDEQQSIMRAKEDLYIGLI